MGSPADSVSSSSPNYDEQIGLTFTDTSTVLDYNVTAVAQTNSGGYGPAYLLNGLSDKGYWYQVGLGWNWNPGTVPGTGFTMNFEVFDSGGNSVFPTSGGGGLLSYSGPVVQGDLVELSLSFVGSTVLMSSRDLSTGAAAAISYGSEEGSEFVGLLAPSNINGFFSGLMTEEYHSSPYYGNILAVNYSSATPLTNGFLWADEFQVAPRTTLFSGSKFVSFLNPGQLQSFSRNGTTEYADAHFLVTGALNELALTLSYSVLGGGSGYSGPELTYTQNGSLHSANLTSTPTTFFADPGTTWSVTNSLSGGASSERWEAAGSPGGTLTGFTTVSIAYYHQFLVHLGYSTEGAGFGVPEIQCVAFGTSAADTGNGSYWADAGSICLYPALLPGSSSSERWVTLNGNESVTNPDSFLVEYYHQYALRLSYDVIGGGRYGAPKLIGLQYGSAVTSTVSNGTSYFLDPGSGWSAPSLLPGSGSDERWIASTPTGGTLTGPTNITLRYYHEFTVRAVASPPEGGAAGNLSSWGDAGSAWTLTPSANPGWMFEGWNGTGVGSYSGDSGTASVLVGSPIVETATFYPGLQISAGSNGEVSYTLGSTAGTVPQGSFVTVFGPPNATVRLLASPSWFLYSFSGWSPGTSGSSAQTTVALSSPKAISASFAIDIPVAIGLVVVVAAVAAIAVLSFRRSRRSAIDIKTPASSLQAIGY
jgi:hypothetical protein